MEDNKKNELEEITLKVDALYEPKKENPPEPETEVPKESVGIDEIEVAEIEADEIDDVDTGIDTSSLVAEQEEEKQEAARTREKKMRPKKEKKPRAAKEPKPPRVPREPAKPISEPALPLLLCLIVFAISLTALVINRFIYPFSQELLAPVILQFTALMIPAYLAIMITSADKSIGMQFKEIGVCAMRAEHVFFLIFTALFTMCASLVLTLMLGGAENASRGIALLGTFTAGINEYTVSYPYLILTYAVIPAIAEEVLFRGVIFSRLEKVSFPLAAVLSCAMSALYNFSLGGLIPAFFVSATLVFVLYTTGSLLACVIVHLLVNIYRLFLEANISAYFLSSQNNLLLLVTLTCALLISSLLFFSESVRIYRAKSEKIANDEKKSANKSEGFKKVSDELRSTLAYKPSLVFSIICGAIFIASVIINYYT